MEFRPCKRKRPGLIEHGTLLRSLSPPRKAAPYHRMLRSLPGEMAPMGRANYNHGSQFCLGIRTCLSFVHRVAPKLSADCIYVRKESITREIEARN